MKKLLGIVLGMMVAASCFAAGAQDKVMGNLGRTFNIETETDETDEMPNEIEIENEVEEKTTIYERNKDMFDDLAVLVGFTEKSLFDASLLCLFGGACCYVIQWTTGTDMSSMGNTLFACSGVCAATFLTVGAVSLGVTAVVIHF